MRSAFGLPQALMIILVISGIVTVTMKYASINAQHYADSYTREQAELFLQSATEAALFKISGYDRNTSKDCIKTMEINSSDNRFSANVNISTYYLYNGLDNNDVNLTNCDRISSIQTPESHGMIDMTITVKSNSTNPKILHPVRLTRRSLQRP